jgi:AmmeMemoRadiSam system protein A
MKFIHPKIAYGAISEYFESTSTKKIESQDIPDILKPKKSCFVTLKTSDDKLRGCIGTLEPRYDNLYKEIIKNAISSAFNDHRFSPLSRVEFKTIKITVEVLSILEEINDIKQLNPKIFGAVISDNYGRRGVLLPDIEGVDTVEQQIEIIKRKAGILQESNKGLSFFRFQSEKFD